ncbi:SMPDL3B family protein [Megaselia abdita]
MPGRYGDYMCDSPYSLLESATLAMKSRQGDNVEFILWTGDALSHSAHPFSEREKLDVIRNITFLLGQTFSSQFVFPVLGHEDSLSFHHLAELWRQWLPTEAVQTFEKGGYYTIEQKRSRLRIIALNTNYMRMDPKYSQSHSAAVKMRPGNGGSYQDPTGEHKYYHRASSGRHHGYHDIYSNGGYSSHHHMNGYHMGTVNGHVNGMGEQVSALSGIDSSESENQWSWFEGVLEKSRKNKEFVYIVGHIPPGSDERHIGSQQNGHTTFTERNNARYLKLIRKYSSIIQGQFFGHLHSDSFRIIYDEKETPVSWIMASPSVSPRKGSLSNNPAMRLYKFETDSGQVLDYTQYYLDLDAANTLGEPNWTPEYNLTHQYGLSDITASSLHSLVGRFLSDDDKTFSKYYRANSVRHETETLCNEICQLNHYCVITRVDYNEYRKCLQPERDPRNSSTTANLALCPLAMLICSSLVNLMGKLRRSFHGNKSNSTCKLKPSSSSSSTTKEQPGAQSKSTSEECSRCRRREGVVLRSLSTVLGNSIIKFRKFPVKFSTDGTVSNRFGVLLRFHSSSFSSTININHFLKTVVNVRQVFLVKCKTTICQTTIYSYQQFLVSLMLIVSLIVSFPTLPLIVLILLLLLLLLPLLVLLHRPWNAMASHNVNVFS